MSKRGYCRAVLTCIKKACLGLVVISRRFNTIIRITLLMSSLTAFSILGGIMFQVVESPVEQITIEVTLEARKKFLEETFDIFVRHGETAEEKDRLAKVKLNLYEIRYVEAIRNGTFFVDGEANPSWTFVGSAYFCVTTFAQLGFGNLAPKSYLGRMVSVLYACISIPVGAIVFADLGNQINHLLTLAWSLVYRTCYGIKESAGEDVDNDFKMPTLHKGKSSGNKRGSNLENRTTNVWAKVFGVAVGNSNGKEETTPGHLEKSSPESPSLSLSFNNSNANHKEDWRSGNYPFFSQHASTRRRKNVPKVVSSEHSDENTVREMPGHVIRTTRTRLGQEWSSGSEKQGCFNLGDVFKAIGGRRYNRKRTVAKIEMNDKVERFFRTIVSSPCCPVIIRLAFVRNKVYARLLRLFSLSDGGDGGQNLSGSDRHRLNRRNRNNSNSHLHDTGHWDYEFEDSDDDYSEDESVRSEIDLIFSDPLPVIIINILLMLAYVQGGIIIVTSFENWSKPEAGWFLIMSVLTVGYGDIIPSNSEFFAFFLPYLILGIAIFSNVIGTLMALLSNIAIRTSNIGKDMYNTAAIRSRYEILKRKGQRARRWWWVLRAHIRFGLPNELVVNSRDFKRKLLQRERIFLKEAFRIYFLLSFEAKIQELIKALSATQLSLRPGSGSVALSKSPGMQVQAFTPMMAPVVPEKKDAATEYKRPKVPNIFQRVRFSVSRRYSSFKEYLATPSDFL